MTRLTLEVNDRKVICEMEYFDLDLKDLFQMFKASLVGVTWLESSIDDYIIELGEELKELKEN